MINQVTLVGRLTKDPDLRLTPEGTPVCNLTLAVTRQFRNQQGEHETDFVQCTLWRKTAENTANFCRKGSILGITGKIHTRNYLNQEGKRVYVTEVIAEQVQFLSKKPSDEQRPTPTPEREAPVGQSSGSASTSGTGAWIPTPANNGSADFSQTTSPSNNQGQSSEWMIAPQKAEEEANATAAAGVR